MDEPKQVVSGAASQVVAEVHRLQFGEHLGKKVGIPLCRSRY
jgi:hypothetical protein